jgi:hypothetical protein
LHSQSERIPIVRAVHALFPRRWVIAVAVLVLGSLTATSPTMAALARSSNPLRPLPWGKEIQILGGGNPGVFTSLSCGAEGYCTAVGYWNFSTPSGSYTEGFILDETRGRWGAPFKVPGLNANERVGSFVASVSCRAPGACTAGGAAGAPFSNGAFGFVLNEQGGVWGRARPEPGPGSLALSPNDLAGVESVSCFAPGDCAAVGQYADTSGKEQGFVVDETNGVWNAAQDVPGLATLGDGGYPTVDSVSCTGVGDCSAAGSLYDGQGFVVDESHGTWGNAEAIPGLSSLHGNDIAPLIALSCAAPGDCSAVGADGTDGSYGGYVVDESGGTWGTAQPIPGLTSLNTGNFAVLGAISCWAVGSCDAVGMYSVAQSVGPERGFLVEERAGTWHRARTIPGLVAVTGDGYALPTTISCDATGDCAAGGVDGGGANFLVDKVRGVWHDAAAIRNGDGQSTEISCVAGDHCAVATDAYKPAETGEVASGPLLPRRS